MGATWADLAAFFESMEDAGLGPVLIFGRSREACWMYLENGIILGPLSIPAR